MVILKSILESIWLCILGYALIHLFLFGFKFETHNFKFWVNGFVPKKFYKDN